MKKNKIVPISIIGLVLVLLSIIAAYIITEKNNFTLIENSQKNIVNDNKTDVKLTSDQIKEMYANGIDIQSHTVNHEDLDKLSLEKQQETLVQSKQFLEKLLNKKVDFIAYPSGKYNNFTEQAAKNAGYTMAFTINSGWANRDTNIYFLNRVFVNALKDFEQFKERLNNSNYE